MAPPDDEEEQAEGAGGSRGRGEPEIQVRRGRTIPWEERQERRAMDTGIQGKCPGTQTFPWGEDRTPNQISKEQTVQQ